MAKEVTIDGSNYVLLHPTGKRHIKVLRPEDTGMEFKPGDGHNKLRRKDITLGIVHWTGSENAVPTMFNVLNKRKLGVEFCIDPHGTLYQFCDPVRVDTADAGAANSISWGVEIVNAGIRRANTLWREPRYRKEKMGPRHPYAARIHGRVVKCWDFYPEQTATLCALNRLMVRAIPSYSDNVCTSNGVIDWRNFNGAVGHFHITERKLDPGIVPMDNLAHFMETGKLPTYMCGGAQQPEAVS